MFTGIITDVGRICKIDGADQVQLSIQTKYKTEDVIVGASIACSGMCLTVTAAQDDWFSVLASAQTL